MRHANKALRHKGFLLFLLPSALSTAASEYQAVANDRVTPDSGHDGSHFGRLLDGKNVPQADLLLDMLPAAVTGGLTRLFGRKDARLIRSFYL